MYLSEESRQGVRGRGWHALMALALMLVPALPAGADQVEVRLALPVRARIDLMDRKTLTVTPFLVLSQEGIPSRKLCRVLRDAPLVQHTSCAL